MRARSGVPRRSSAFLKVLGSCPEQPHMAKQPSSRASRSWTRRPPPLCAPAVRCGISLRKKGNRRHPGNPDRQPGQATTSATHRVPSHAGPSPRAAGAPIGVGLGSSPGLSVLLPPQRIAGSYPSFQPPGGLAPGVPSHHGAPGPAPLPHDRRVRSPSPGNPTRSRWLETALFTAMAVNPHSP